MKTLTTPPPALAPRHAVRIGHTTFLPAPLPMSMAACCGEGGWCEFHSTGADVRADGVHHAEQAGHVVLVGEGRTVTVVEVTS